MLGDFIKGLLGGGIEKIGEAIDKNVTSDEERLRLANELAKIEADVKEKADTIGLQYERELSERHKADMQSDSWLPKNIRPLSLAYLLAIVSMLALFDGNIGTFTVGVAYIELFQQLLLLAFGFYFGSRGIEKVVKTWKGKD